MRKYSSLKFYRELWGDSGFRKYFHNISWMFWARMMTMGISFLATLYVARTLGPVHFGELDYALAIIGMFGIVGAWGIETVLNRELITYPERHNELLGTAMLLRFCFGLLSTFGVILFSVISHVDQLSKMLLIILSIIHTTGVLTLLQQPFLAQVKSKYPSLITVCVTLIINIAKVVILLTGKGVLYIALAFVMESIIYSLLYFIAYTHILKGTVSSWKFSKETVQIFIKTGGAIAFLGAFAMIYSRIDQIMIRHILDATSVGLYSAGVRLVDLWSFIPGILGTALYPAIINAKKVSEQLYAIRLRKLFFMYAVPSFAIALFLSLSAKLLIVTIFGEQFIGGSHSLQVYAWSLPGTFIGFFILNILFIDDNKKLLIITTAIPACINVILNMLWIPEYGIIGAAWATTISYSLIPVTPLLFKNVRKKLYTVYKPHTAL